MRSMRYLLDAPATHSMGVQDVYVCCAGWMCCEEWMTESIFMVPALLHSFEHCPNNDLTSAESSSPIALPRRLVLNRPTSLQSFAHCPTTTLYVADSANSNCSSLSSGPRSVCFAAFLLSWFGRPAGETFYQRP